MAEVRRKGACTQRAVVQPKCQMVRRRAEACPSHHGDGYWSATAYSIRRFLSVGAPDKSVLSRMTLMRNPGVSPAPGWRRAAVSRVRLVHGDSGADAEHSRANMARAERLDDGAEVGRVPAARRGRSQR